LHAEFRDASALATRTPLGERKIEGSREERERERIDGTNGSDEMRIRGGGLLQLTDDTAITILRVREIADDNAAGSVKTR